MKHSKMRGNRFATASIPGLRCASSRLHTRKTGTPISQPVSTGNKIVQALFTPVIWSSTTATGRRTQYHSNVVTERIRTRHPSGSRPSPHPARRPCLLRGPEDHWFSVVSKRFLTDSWFARCRAPSLVVAHAGGDSVKPLLKGRMIASPYRFLVRPSRFPGSRHHSNR